MKHFFRSMEYVPNINTKQEMLLLGSPIQDRTKDSLNCEIPPLPSHLMIQTTAIKNVCLFPGTPPERLLPDLAHPPPLPLMPRGVAKFLGTRVTNTTRSSNVSV